MQLQAANFSPLNGGFQSLEAMAGFKKFGSGGGGGSLQDDVPSTCFVLDAADAASYPGTGQTWSNIIAAPADGSSQSAWDMYLGATSSPSTDDPTFNGTAGSAGCYFSFDGGDVFTGVGAAPGFSATAHRSSGGSDWWFAVPCRLAQTFDSSKALFGTQSSAASRGLRLQSSTAKLLSMFQRGASTGTSTSTGFTHDITSDYLFIVSGQAGGGTHKYWFDSRTASTLSLTYGADTTDVSNAIYLGGLSSSLKIGVGARIYGFAGGNAYLDDEDAGKIFDYFNTATGITFA